GPAKPRQPRPRPATAVPAGGQLPGPERRSGLQRREQRRPAERGGWDPERRPGQVQQPGRGPAGGKRL
ncbi:MAG: hypothetical protein AVDCRST_MAG02-3478, partial [uncultured Rubrobacteraceae bacterium]